MNSQLPAHLYFEDLTLGKYKANEQLRGQTIDVLSKAFVCMYVVHIFILIFITQRQELDLS